MSKAQSLILGSIIAGSTLLFGACTLDSSQSTTPDASLAPIASTLPGEANKTYTLAEVAAHASENDCWMVIENNVYNVTGAIAQHPGGKDILEGCGKDATSLFNARPGERNTPHSPKASTMLSQFKIGELAQ